MAARGGEHRHERQRVVVDQATDGGVGCATITAPGAVGVRGDNANFNLENFLVEAY